MDTDITLIEGCLRKEEWAQKELYGKYKGKLMGICSRYCNSREQAQDVLQEAFIIIFTSIQAFKGSGTFEGWMTRIAINTAIKQSKKWDYRKSSDEIENIDLPYSEINPVQKLTHKELLQMVQDLPTGYRTVFNMFVIDGYSHEEIAKELNINIGTSKSQLSRAKNMLATRINALEPNKKMTYEEE